MAPLGSASRTPWPPAPADVGVGAAAQAEGQEWQQDRSGEPQGSDTRTGGDRDRPGHGQGDAQDRPVQGEVVRGDRPRAQLRTRVGQGLGGGVAREDHGERPGAGILHDGGRIGPARVVAARIRGWVARSRRRSRREGVVGGFDDDRRRPVGSIGGGRVEDLVEGVTVAVGLPGSGVEHPDGAVGVQNDGATGADVAELGIVLRAQREILVRCRRLGLGSRVVDVGLVGRVRAADDPQVGEGEPVGRVGGPQGRVVLVVLEEGLALGAPFADVPQRGRTGDGGARAADIAPGGHGTGTARAPAERARSRVQRVPGAGDLLNPG